MVLLVSVVFVNKITKEVILLAITGIMLYAAASIHNAIRDSDYQLPKYSRYTILFLIFVALSISVLNPVILITALLWVLLGFFYNTVARFILFGDATVLAITHFFLPSLSASILLGLEFKFTLQLAAFMFFTFWFIIHSKNLKDTLNDKKRGYKTLTTMTKNGKRIAIIFLGISFAFMLVAYFLFNLTKLYWVFLSIIYILGPIAIIHIIKNKEDFAVLLIRGVMLLFLFGLIISKAIDIRIVLFALSLCFIYGIILIKGLISPIQIYRRTLNEDRFSD